MDRTLNSANLIDITNISDAALDALLDCAGTGNADLGHLTKKECYFIAWALKLDARIWDGAFPSSPRERFCGAEVKVLDRQDRYWGDH